METHLTQQSVTEIHEQELVLRLMSDPHWRSRIINIHGIPDNVDYYLEIPLDGLPSQPQGDIDVLLVPPDCPEFSTAIQIKRIKVTNDSFATGQPNKLGQFVKGVQQANILALLGFAQVYLYVFVVVDSRMQNIGKYSYEGLTPWLRSKIDDSISLSGLEKRVGLIKFDFTQPMDYVPLSIGAYGGSLIRSAKPSLQPNDVTDWIVEATSPTDA